MQVTSVPYNNTIEPLLISINTLASNVRLAPACCNLILCHPYQNLAAHYSDTNIIAQVRMAIEIILTFLHFTNSNVAIKTTTTENKQQKTYCCRQSPDPTPAFLKMKE